MEQSRLVRDLLDANLQLTNQLVELARMVIGAPPAASVEASTYAAEPAPSVQAPVFALSTDDDWEDIPDEPLGAGAQVIEISRREVPDLPLHMTEDEEDMRHSVAMGLKPSTELTELLKRMGTPGTDVDVVEFAAPEA